MDKIDFINYRILTREVKQLKEQLAALEAALYSPKGQRFTSTPHAASGPKNTMEDAVAGHLRLVDLYQQKLSEQQDKLLRIEVAIADLADPAQRVVMRERYILGNSWVRVCEKLRTMGYSERQVYRLHGYALLNLKEV